MITGSLSNGYRKEDCKTILKRVTEKKLKIKTTPNVATAFDWESGEPVKRKILRIIRFKIS